MRRIVASLTVPVLVAVALIGTPDSAAANDHTAGSGYTSLGAGNSLQYIEWNRTLRRVRLEVKTDANMPTNLCFEATFDWRTANGAHYDQRTVRNCDPGSVVETDPGGDNFWNEPADWDTRPVNGVSRAYGVKIDDSSLDILLSSKLFGSSNSVYGGQGHPPPTVGDPPQYWTAIRTRYQGGAIVSRRLEVNPERCVQQSC